MKAIFTEPELDIRTRAGTSSEEYIALFALSESTIKKRSNRLDKTMLSLCKERQGSGKPKKPNDKV